MAEPWLDASETGRDLSADATGGDSHEYAEESSPEVTTETGTRSDSECCAGGSFEGPTLVPKNEPFWHKACCCRCWSFLAAYLLMLLTGLEIADHISEVSGRMLLTAGPTAVILLCFFRRFVFSTTTRQIVFTFLEAIAWMMPLGLLAMRVDAFNDSFASSEVEVPCTWPLDRGAEVLIWILSFTARCSAIASVDEQPGLRLDGNDCPVDRVAGVASHVVIPEDGAITDSLFERMLHVANLTGALRCSDLDAALPTMIGDLRVASITQGNTSVNIDGRAGLDTAYLDLCAEAEVGHGDRWCSYWPKGEAVSAIFTLKQRTVFNAVVLSYFRAGFLEELLKYLAVRRILFMDRVVDPSGLIVYGLAAGAGFATAENFRYNALGGVRRAVFRMCMSIPLHCVTGMIIGVFLGYRKFLGKGYPWVGLRRSGRVLFPGVVR